MTNWFESLEVKGDFTPATLDDYFKAIQQWLKKDMEFFRPTIVSRRLWSNWVRGAAFAALVLGVLLPLPLFDPPKRGIDGLEMGYVAVLVGGLILMFDQIFAISSSWMRLTMAEMQVKQVRYRLDLEWAKRRPLLTPENAATEGPALIDILKAAVDAGHEIMETQKESWTNELRQGMEALRSRLDSDRIALQQLRTQRRQEEARPKAGAINLTIDKPTDLKGPLTVRVGSEERLKLDTVPAKVSVNMVPAGLQTIRVSASRAAAPHDPFEFMVTEAIVAGEPKAVTVAVG
jgi:hypothetical protein